MLAKRLIRKSIEVKFFFKLIDVTTELCSITIQLQVVISHSNMKMKKMKSAF